jgi:hypothetical protein
MKYGILNLVVKISGKINGHYKKINLFIKKRGNYFIPVSSYIIKDSESDEQFNFLFIGWDQKLCHYWLSRFPGEFEIRPERKNIATWKIPEFLKKNEGKFDLVIIESNRKALPGKYPGSFCYQDGWRWNLILNHFLKSPTAKR